MAAFRAELQKAHRRHDLALCLLIPGIVVLWVGGLARQTRRSLPTVTAPCFTACPSLKPF